MKDAESTEAVGALSDMIAVYHGPTAARNGWVLVLVAGALTAGMFALLPFSSVIARSAREDVQVRPVETVAVERERPKVRLPRSCSAVTPAVQPAQATVRPVLKELPCENQPELNLGVELDANLQTDAGLKVDFQFAPQAFVGVAPIQPLPAAPAPTGPLTVEELDTPPRALVRIPAVYPYRAKSRNIQGFVDVRFTVTKEGRVKDVEVVAAAPGDVFVDVVKRTVVQWRFEPGRKDGRAVAVRMKTRLRFKLE